MSAIGEVGIRVRDFTYTFQLSKDATEGKPKLLLATRKVENPPALNFEVLMKKRVSQSRAEKGKEPLTEGTAY